MGWRVAVAVVLLLGTLAAGQVCRLAVKKGAQGFDIFPRNTNACPQLLNSGLTEQFFFSDLVCGDAFLFQLLIQFFQFFNSHWAIFVCHTVQYT